MTLTEPKCFLCKKPLFVNTEIESRIGKWTFHPDCYSTVLHRLTNFMEIILLPENEFNEWLEDDSQ